MMMMMMMVVRFVIIIIMIIMRVWHKTVLFVLVPRPQAPGRHSVRSAWFSRLASPRQAQQGSCTSFLQAVRGWGRDLLSST